MTFAPSRPWKLMLGSAVIALAGAMSLTAFAAPHHGGAMHGRMVERMLDGVNASDEQRAQIRQIMRDAGTDLKAQRESARALREQALALFTQPDVDANAAEALRQQMMAQHDQRSRRMMQAMLDAGRVLSPEQRAQLGERMKQRRELRERHHRERGQLDTPRS